MTIEDLEHRFHNSAAEGIIDTAGGDGSLGPEEMRRFFRKVLDVNVHEAKDKNLAIAFRAMDEDGGGTLDADEFLDFIKAAIAIVLQSAGLALPNEKASSWSWSWAGPQGLA